MDRRDFIRDVGVVGSYLGIVPSAWPRPAINKATRLSPQNPKAVAMWDFSWLLRTYRGGSFENWDKALDELIIRGYDALRIDVFPQFIAKNEEGIASESYFLPKKGYHPALWGNEYSTTITPKEGLVTFLKKCAERNISIIPSSWFYGHGTKRNQEFSGIEGLTKAWNETLHFLSENDLLQNVMYIDVLNEYPLWHGYSWLNKELQNYGPGLSKKPFDFLNERNTKCYNDLQIQIYNRFINTVLKRLKGSWPNLKFTCSLTNTLNTPWEDINPTQMDVIDIHLWMIYNQKFSQFTGYFENVHQLKGDVHYQETNKKIHEYWQKNKLELTEWLGHEVKRRSALAAEKNVPVGNTEGWGAIMWQEHPSLEWDFIKEAGIIGAKKGVEYNYSFNCSSNFTHPHFSRLWDDISWHKEVTTIIKKK